jgi:hypothetical protein
MTTTNAHQCMEACQFSFRAFVHGEDERALGIGADRPNMRKPRGPVVSDWEKRLTEQLRRAERQLDAEEA